MIFRSLNGKLTIRRTFKTLIILSFIKCLATVLSSLTLMNGTRTQEMAAVLFPQVFSKAKGRMMFLLILNGISNILINTTAGMIIVILTTEYLGVAHSLKNHVL